MVIGRALAYAIVAVVTATACITAFEPKPSPTAPPTSYPSLGQAVNAILDVHVDRPTTKALLDAATSALKRLLSEGGLIVPTSDPRYENDVGEDLPRFFAYLDAIRGQNPQVDADAIEPAGLFALAAGLRDCGTTYAEEPPPSAGGAPYGGVGAVVSEASDATGGMPWFATVFPGGPAEAAGMRQGDRLKAVDGRSVVGARAADVAAIVRGPAGSQVQLTIVRGSEERMVAVTRALVQLPALVDQTLDGDIGHVTLLALLPDAPAQLRQLLERWDRAGVRGWVLDLRSNGGGDVQVTGQIAGTFVQGGTLWVQSRRDGGPAPVTAVASDHFAKARPLAVLIAPGTQGSAIWIAAALKERGAARVFGEPSAEGCAATRRPVQLRNGGTLYITAGRAISAVTNQPLDRVDPHETVARGALSDPALAAAAAWLRSRP